MISLMIDKDDDLFEDIVEIDQKLNKANKGRQLGN